VLIDPGSTSCPTRPRRRGKGRRGQWALSAAKDSEVEAAALANGFSSASEWEEEGEGGARRNGVSRGAGRGYDGTVELREGCRAGFHGKGGDLAADAKAAATRAGARTSGARGQMSVERQNMAHMFFLTKGQSPLFH
jgi:hypothetical protein